MMATQYKAWGNVVWVIFNEGSLFSEENTLDQVFDLAMMAVVAIMVAFWVSEGHGRGLLPE